MKKKLPVDIFSRSEFFGGVKLRLTDLWLFNENLIQGMESASYLVIRVIRLGQLYKYYI